MEIKFVICRLTSVLNIKKSLSLFRSDIIIFKSDIFLLTILLFISDSDIFLTVSGSLFLFLLYLSLMTKILDKIRSKRLVVSEIFSINFFINSNIFTSKSSVFGGLFWPWEEISIVKGVSF